MEITNSIQQPIEIKKLNKINALEPYSDKSFENQCLIQRKQRIERIEKQLEKQIYKNQKLEEEMDSLRKTVAEHNRMQTKEILQLKDKIIYLQEIIIQQSYNQNHNNKQEKLKA